MKIFIISSTITNSLHSHSSVWLNVQTHWEGCCEICLIAFLPLSPQADQDHRWSLFVISTYISNHAVDKRSICLVKRSKQSHLDESNVMRLSILIPANRSFHSSKKQFLVPKKKSNLTDLRYQFNVYFLGHDCTLNSEFLFGFAIHMYHGWCNCFGAWPTDSMHVDLYPIVAALIQKSLFT